MTAGLDFPFLACRAVFRAAGRIQFPPQAANALRGVLGFALAPELFRPVLRSGPSGLRNPPRPFVLHASHLDGAAVARRERFFIDLAVFQQDAQPFRAALESLGKFAAGPAALEDFETRRNVVDLAPRESAPPRIRLRFLTPTELKGGAPEFALLMARLRDRISALRSFYGAGPPSIDFKGFLDAAREVRCLGGEMIQVAGSRRSSRTGQTHPLGGFTGYSDYEGDFRAYLPWLEAAEYTCVGRQTVWGHGRLIVEPLD
ncbi:MAG: CRISPR system precrRNA processing endoribonuclease RAMP protein Cas6 [Bryobacteraceae bacterium]|nr:CRISPR system precrRNA processing endoribonuclease RAMP protein Cas6 [Bryobacteraceae bacterium]